MSKKSSVKNVSKKSASTKGAKKPKVAAARVARAAKPTDAAKAGRARAEAGADRAEHEREARVLPPVGTVIHKRDRHGETRCSCKIVEGGVSYEGTVYKSLSAAAMAAATDLGLENKTQNGWVFWGLVKPRAAAKDLVEAFKQASERFRAKVTTIKTGLKDADKPALRVLIDKFDEDLAEMRIAVG
jgi:hypothetical protein